MPNILSFSLWQQKPKISRYYLLFYLYIFEGAVISLTISILLQVARYNTLQQNAQTLNVNLSNVVLHRAKTEILRCVELLIDKMHTEISDLLVEVSQKLYYTIEVLEKNII